jgi:hypothetical protein
MRWARREGKRDKVKFAEESRAASLSGGLPCLIQVSQGTLNDLEPAYLTRSARVRGRRGFAASLYISSSDTVALVGGCDHWLMSGGNGWAVLCVVVAHLC